MLDELQSFGVHLVVDLHEHEPDPLRVVPSVVAGLESDQVVLLAVVSCPMLIIVDDLVDLVVVEFPGSFLCARVRSEIGLFPAVLLGSQLKMDLSDSLIKE